MVIMMTPTSVQRYARSSRQDLEEAVLLEEAEVVGEVVTKKCVTLM
jgi:hypothetical protein